MTRSSRGDREKIFPPYLKTGNPAHIPQQSQSLDVVDLKRQGGLKLFVSLLNSS
jgi:hypothetical protein